MPFVLPKVITYDLITRTEINLQNQNAQHLSNKKSSIRYFKQTCKLCNHAANYNSITIEMCDKISQQNFKLQKHQNIQSKRHSNDNICHKMPNALFSNTAR